MSLSVEQLQFAYRNCFQVLRGVSFTAESGEFLSVLGPNGCGKSTLFRCILGILPGYTGEVLVDGDDIRTMTTRERAQRIAYIPQTHRPTFGYTVLDTAMMGINRQLSPLANPGKEQVQQAWEALCHVGVEHLAERNFTHLSGGEQQLVLVARAIAQQADILIMDEPTSGLDPVAKAKFFEMLIQEVEQREIGVLISSHNLDGLESICDSITMLHQGCVEKQLSMEDMKSELTKLNVVFEGGATKEIYNMPQILKLHNVGSIYTMVVKEYSEIFVEKLRKNGFIDKPL